MVPNSIQVLKYVIYIIFADVIFKDSSPPGVWHQSIVKRVYLPFPETKENISHKYTYGHRFIHIYTKSLSSLVLNPHKNGTMIDRHVKSILRSCGFYLEVWFSAKYFIKGSLANRISLTHWVEKKCFYLGIRINSIQILPHPRLLPL